ncbi:MAG: type II toxin-antitoxin system HicA family toxin [Pyrinomonadaceae bacterium]|nr:type II toxin-antitoxin system HicA family toxin [Pyrinomonadaceae bacterium]
MSRLSKTLEQILRGNSDPNIDFNDLRSLLSALKFRERIRGSHHIFTRTGVTEIINLQPKGSKAKSYQVRQVRQLITKYGLGEDDV